MAYETPEKMFGRSVRWVVQPVEAVRVGNIRTDDQVIEAQRDINTDMLRALEEMVNAAKAGRLEGAAALNLAALKW